jgi:hypothetical protein
MQLVGDTLLVELLTGLKLVGKNKALNVVISFLSYRVRFWTGFHENKPLNSENLSA